MSIFRMYNEYINYKSREWEDFLLYLFYDEYTDIDNTHSEELDSNYTMSVGNDELPF